MFFLEDGAVLAFSPSKDHLERTARFHSLEGTVTRRPSTGLRFDPRLYRFPQVYLHLLSVPRGATITYGELASSTGLHVRQVVAALRHNPFPLLVPCHRVVGARHHGGHSPLGEEFKKILLELEQL